MVKPPPPIRKRSLGRLAAAAVVGLCVYGVIDFESGAQRKPFRRRNSSSYTQSNVPFMTSLLPSLVSAVILKVCTSDGRFL